MAGRLYRMAKVVSANPKNWGVVDANEISGFRQVSAVADLYNIAECILSSAYGDGTTDGADAVGQIWHVTKTNEDYRLTNWANRKSASGWTKVTYGSDVSVPVKSVFQNTGNGLSNIVNSEGNATIDAYTKSEINTKINTVSSAVDTLESKLTSNISDVSKVAQQNKTDISTLNTKFNSLDQTLFEVVTELPKTTATIKKHIYLVKGTGATGNVYDEWIYTGNLTTTYDSTKWEKFGTVEADTNIGNAVNEVTIKNAGTTGFTLDISKFNGGGGGTTVTYPVLKGATSSTAGTQGLVPAPTAANVNMYLRGDGKWATPTNTDTHWSSILSVGVNNTAASGATTNGNTYLKLHENNQSRGSFLIKGTGATTVSSDASGNITINSTNTTYSNATQTAAGLMSTTDKKKIDSITDNYIEYGSLIGFNGEFGRSYIAFHNGETGSVETTRFAAIGASDDAASAGVLILCNFAKCSTGYYTNDIINGYVEKYGNGAVIIDSPYVLNDIAISGNTLTITKGDQTTKTITLPSYTVATASKAGLVKPRISYSISATCPTGASVRDSSVTINAITDTANRYYAITTDKDGLPFVNVPWVDTNTTVSNVTAADSGNNVTVTVTSSNNTSKTATVCSKLTESEILAILN